MRIKALLSVFFMFCSIQSVVHAEQKSSPSCASNEYYKIVLTDGQSAKSSFYAVAPSIYSDNVKIAFDERSGALNVKEKLEWDAYRYRVEETPGSKKFTAFEFIGEASPMSQHKISIKYATERSSTIDENGLELANVSIDKKHAIMFLKKDPVALNLQRTSLNSDEFYAHVKKNIVMIAVADDPVEKNFTPYCSCRGVFGGTSCCTAPICNSVLGECQSNSACRQSGACSEFTFCSCS